MKASELREKARLAISLRWVTPYERISAKIEELVDRDPFLLSLTFGVEDDPWLCGLKDGDIASKVLDKLREDGYLAHFIGPRTLQVSWEEKT